MHATDWGVEWKGEPTSRDRDGPREITEVLTLLGLKKRLEILAALCGRTLSVSQIAQALEYDVADVCKQLKVLRGLGLVQDARAKKDHLQSIGRGGSVTMKGTLLRIEVLVPDESRVIIEQRLTDFFMNRLARCAVPMPPEDPGIGGPAR